MNRYRLTAGGAIDRGWPLRFRFDGRDYVGYAGDTLTSALLANGVHFIGRSFKYHRPRGILGAGAEDPNALFALARGGYYDSSAQGTLVELYDGLEAQSLNAWPSLGCDFAAVNDLLYRFLPAGFYYKTFKWPRWSWFEGAIRRLAGLGESPHLPDAERYDHRHIHVDLLVVGGGVAGLRAARAAAADGARVLVTELDHAWGGAVLWNRDRIDGRPGLDWVAGVMAELRARPEVTLLPRTTVCGYYDHNYLTALEQVADHLPLVQRDGNQPRQRLWHIRAARVLLATGAHERPLLFPGNDRPGILLASAMRCYLNRYAVTPGRRVVVATNNDSAYATALDLRAAGVEVAAIIDSRADPSGPLVAAAEAAGLRLYRGAVIRATEGRHRLRNVTLARRDGGGRQHIACDALAMSGGWNPVVHLFSQSGGRLRYDPDCAAFVPDISGQPGAVQPVEVAGHLSGDGLQDHGTEPDWRVPAKPAAAARQWIDFHNDVTAADVALAARENFVSVEHLKRYTTLGMASDQGKTANVNGLAVMGALTGRSPPEVGTTSFRPPYVPLGFGVIAGRRLGAFFLPGRSLPLADRHAALGAVMQDYGDWRRPGWYPRPGEDMAEDMAGAIRREVRAVRSAVGLLDYSPLGKIELRGPDAGEFLNRMLLTNVATLQPGRCRYHLMLNEAGVIIDDGLLSRLGPDHYLLGTTSGGADRIAAHLEQWRQCEWPDLRVFINNVTTAWGVIMLAGPKARDLLFHAGLDLDLAPQSFPHMSCRDGRMGGVPLRVQRVSFTGELGFEIALPTPHMAVLWDRLLALGATPFGLESLMVLRTEKGFLHVGGDTDGTTLPDDVGFGAVAARKDRDFIGKRALMLAAARRADRLQLVGLASAMLLPVGGHCLNAAVTAVPAASEGHVTSSCWSPTLGRPLALALLAAGRSRMGEQIRIYDQGRWHAARVVDPRFYDPEGSRMNG